MPPISPDLHTEFLDYRCGDEVFEARSRSPTRASAGSHITPPPTAARGRRCGGFLDEVLT
jgi:hypothetical protein